LYISFFFYQWVVLKYPVSTLQSQLKRSLRMVGIFIFLFWVLGSCLKNIKQIAQRVNGGGGGGGGEEEEEVGGNGWMDGWMDERFPVI